MIVMSCTRIKDISYELCVRASSPSQYVVFALTFFRQRNVADCMCVCVYVCVCVSLSLSLHIYTYIYRNM